MPETNLRALCNQLLQAYEWCISAYMTGPPDEDTLVLRARAALAQPEPAVVPVAVSDALIQAECALSDVAEGEPECDDGDPSQWAEQRCAETLAIIRPVMKLHKIRTSEWPPKPLPQPEPVAPTDEELDRFADEVWRGSPRRYARAVLARWGHPFIKPVSVSEFLPETEDCDTEGRCWLFGKTEGDWRLVNPSSSGLPQLKYCFSHWLPYYSLPILATEKNQ